MKRPASKIGTLQPLAPIVEQVMHQAGLGRVPLLGHLQQQWQAIVGPQVAAVTFPVTVAEVTSRTGAELLVMGSQEVAS